MSHQGQIQSLTGLFRSLSNLTRLRILVLLSIRALCVCELCDILKQPQPKVSRHLATLRHQGLVRDVREGQFVFYHLSGEDQMVEEVIRVISDSSQRYETISGDIQALKRKEETQTLCTRQG